MCPSGTFCYSGGDRFLLSSLQGWRSSGTSIFLCRRNSNCSINTLTSWRLRYFITLKLYSNLSINKRYVELFSNRLTPPPPPWHLNEIHAAERMGLLRGSSHLYQTQWHFGHFLPRRKDGVVCLCLCGCLRCAAGARVQALLTEHSPFGNQDPAPLVFCILRDSGPSVLPVSFGLCFPHSSDASAHPHTHGGFVSLLVCHPQTAARLKTSISSSSKIPSALVWASQLLGFLQNQSKWVCQPEVVPEFTVVGVLTQTF